MNHRRRFQSRLAARGGTILVCVLVCLSIATMLVAAATRSALQSHRQIRVERQLRQVELLVESGARRAFTQLEQDPAYLGESWLLDAKALPGFPAALVEITVRQPTSQSTQQVRVVAVLPADAQRPVRRSGDFLFTPITTSTPNEEIKP